MSQTGTVSGGCPRPFLTAAPATIHRLEVLLDKHRLWSKLRIDASRVRRTIDWWQLVDRLAADARKTIRARGVFQIHDLLEVRRDEVRLGGGIVLENLRQARLFAGAEKVALCAVTLGEELDSLCNSLAVAGNYAEASVLSMTGDCALAEAQSRLIALAQSSLDHTGLAAGVVLQPGAQYWDIRGNETLAATLPLEALGIRLLESLSLSPSKSKTFACAFRTAAARASSREAD